MPPGFLTHPRPLASRARSHGTTTRLAIPTAGLLGQANPRLRKVGSPLGWKGPRPSSRSMRTGQARTQGPFKCPDVTCRKALDFTYDVHGSCPFRTLTRDRLVKPRSQHSQPSPRNAHWSKRPEIRGPRTASPALRTTSWVSSQTLYREATQGVFILGRSLSFANTKAEDVKSLLFHREVLILNVQICQGT